MPQIIIYIRHLQRHKPTLIQNIFVQKQQVSILTDTLNSFPNGTPYLQAILRSNQSNSNRADKNILV